MKKKYNKKHLFLRIFVYLFVVVMFLPTYTFFLYTHPSRYQKSFTPKLFNLEFEDVIIKTQDNLELSAWFIPNDKSDKAIIVCHGYPASKENVLEMAEFLSKDYNLLYFDFRAMGRSQGNISSVGWNEKKDFRAAVDYLLNRGIKNIGAFGFSMGAAVILMSDFPEVKCLVSDSSYSNLEEMMYNVYKDYGMLQYPIVGVMKFWFRLILGFDVAKASPVKVIAQRNIPILLIHGENDSQIPVSHANQLYQANPKSELWIVPNAEHLTSYIDAIGEYEKRVREFFKNNF